jgi:hypothetical protein
MDLCARLIPIVSSYSENPQFQERIDEFVYGVSSRLDDMQNAQIDGDFALCGKLMADLSHDAENLGFDPLFQVAQEVMQACEDEDDELLLQKLQEALVIVQRIKLGHRSAA